MRAVSERLLDALGTSHKIKTIATCTTPDGVQATLRLKSGSVSVDATSSRRRRAALRAQITPAEADVLNTPGASFSIQHGLDFGASVELLPVFHGELVDPSEPIGRGEISLGLVDDSTWLVRVPFPAPYVPSPTATRAAVIAAIVVAARPATVVSNLATDAGQVGVQMWTGSRLSAIEQLATDGNMEAFFGPDGVFYIRDLPRVGAQPVWTVTGGTAGTLIDATRRRVLDKLVNTVTVRPAATTGAQTWAPQTATIEDPLHPLHSSRIGVATLFVDAITTATAAEALALARTMRDRLAISADRLNLGMIANPALEGNDAIRIIAPAVGRTPAQQFQHWIDAFTIDLITGTMSADTRSQVVLE